MNELTEILILSVLVGIFVLIAGLGFMVEEITDDLDEIRTQPTVQCDG